MFSQLKDRNYILVYGRISLSFWSSGLPWRYDGAGVGGETTGVKRLKGAEVKRNSFTRFNVVRDGLACGRLDMIHCSRVFMDCLSAISRAL
jgi:hypothetical protein